MRLGIVVVYLVQPDYGPLLDLHLRQIKRCTTVPFVLYASAQRLLPAFRPRLEAERFVKICDVPPTDLRWIPEHAYYLDHLVETAIADGATHVVTLHVDSFPIRPGWVEELLPRLTESCVAAAILRAEIGDEQVPLPACLLFTREFWLRYQPRFLPSDEVSRSPAFQAFQKQFSVRLDSGAGYGFTMFTHGLQWHRLLRSNARNDHHLYAGVYADLVFHLHSASWYPTIRERASGPTQRLLGKLISGVRKGVLLLRLRNLVRTCLPAGILRSAQGALAEFHLDETFRVHDAIRQKLFQDPDRYLNYLRTGNWS